MSMANWTTKLICGARNELLIHEIYAERGMVLSMMSSPGRGLTNWPIGVLPPRLSFVANLSFLEIPQRDEATSCC